MSLETPHKIGKYIVQGELGRGGMGVVYQALDPLIERRVAIKTVSKKLLSANDAQEADSMMQRFKREAQAAGRLTHPNIVAVYDYGETDEIAYIAMEHVAGQGLDVAMRSSKPLEAAQVKTIATQLLDALQFAHTLGVVHRDIKPSNLMMTPDGRVKVCDFGIAQLESSQLTQAGTTLGTPSYMSPEQIQGLPTDRRADLFSAGVVIYQLLTGQRPFVGDTNSIASLMHCVLSGQFLAATEVNPGLDSALDAVLSRALAVHPSNRFQSAAEFAKALSMAFDGVVWQASDSYDITVKQTASAGLAATGLTTTLPKLRKIDFTSVQKKISLDASRPQMVATADRPRVLFVDDEERILSGLKLLFNQHYEVHLATGGERALELLAKYHFHVIVSDQRMPNMTGTELLSKARLASPNTVRILLTGYSDLAAIVGSVNEGEVYRFASKPWNTQDIRATLAEAAAIGQALESAPAPQASDAKPEEAVLFLDSDREVYLAARDLFGRTYRVLHASDLAGALQALQDEKIGVLVADIEDSQHSHQTFFKLLKQEHPEIVTIAMTEASDSELVIELINQARIFRFLNKPLKLPTLLGHVDAAMAMFARQKASPALLKQQKADQKPDTKKPNPTTDEASVGGLILKSLRALRRKFT
jgi:eukaryotic-like serine/threonine-protein kinase